MLIRDILHVNEDNIPNHISGDVHVTNNNDKIKYKRGDNYSKAKQIAASARMKSRSSQSQNVDTPHISGGNYSDM